MKPLVIYHANCTDGFGAAFVAWSKLGDDADYVPMHYGNTINADVRQREVYVLDFSFSREQTEWLLENAKRLVWLDHHRTAFEMWGSEAWMDRTDGLDQGLGSPMQHRIRLNNFKSGAMLAWEYFHPGEDVPELIQLIDDRDRWVFNYGSRSKALHAGLQLEVPWNFKRWSDLVPELGGYNVELGEVINTGYTAMAVHQKQTEASVAKAERCTIAYRDFDTKPVQTADDEAILRFHGLAVNTPNNISEVGNELAKASGSFGLVWYYDAQCKKANCSLRSIGDYDVSATAKCFGGGGHKNAAGFQVDMQVLLNWLK